MLWVDIYTPYPKVVLLVSPFNIRAIFSIVNSIFKSRSYFTTKITQLPLWLLQII